MCQDSMNPKGYWEVWGNLASTTLGPSVSIRASSYMELSLARIRYLV